MGRRPESADREHSPEKLLYSRYYEHDGALRAYANRAMLLAMTCVPTTLIAVGMAAYIRIQPPTVVRVDASGSASMMGLKPVQAPTLVVSQGAASAPNDFERKAFVRLFLERYLNFSPDTVDRSWSEGMNMMTSNLRRETLTALRKENVVGKVQDEQITSVFHLHSLEPWKDDPLRFRAFGVREVHRIHDHRESTERLVGEFNLRVITERRSDENPSGLLIAEYGERLIEGEHRSPVVEPTALDSSK